MAVKKKPKSIVELAVNAGNFNTLVDAVKAADLVDTLEGKGPFTVFAPDNKAFKKIGKKDLKALLKDEKKLGDVLKYHVVSGKVMAKDVAGLTKTNTLLGKELKINANKNGVRINKSKVTKPDIECSNGVIHVIDSPLMPN